MTRAIARINRPSNSGHGTAFAITRSLVLTAFHCVGHTATGELNGTSFDLQFPRWPAVAEVEAADYSLDVALLRLREELPDSLSPLTIGPRPSAGDPFLAPGYPAQVAGVQDFTLSGHVVDPSTRLSNGAPAMQLYCEQSANLVLSGASGAPVLIGEQQTVAGIINWNPRGPGGLAKGGAVYAVPVHEIGSVAEVIVGLIAAADIEHAGMATLVQTKLGAGGRFPEVRTLTPYELGAKYCSYSLRHDPYVPRDLDGRIDEILSEGSSILITGPPLAGKSRTAYEALARVLPRAQVIAPANQRDSLVKLRPLLENIRPSAQPLVLWLDDLNKLLATEAVTPNSIAKIKRQHSNLVIVATGRPDATYQAPELRYLSEIFQSELPTMENVELADYSSAAEREAAAESYPNETFDDIGIGERLVAGPELWRRYNDPSEPHTRALMCAAIDWQRSGRDDPIAQNTLFKLYEFYLVQQAPGADPSAQAFNEAIRHARSPVSSRIAMLTVASRSPSLSYEPMDYLVSREDSARNRVPRPIHPVTPDLALQDSTPLQALFIGLRSRVSGLSDIEEKAIGRALTQPMQGGPAYEFAYFAAANFEEHPEYCHNILARLNAVAAEPETRWRAAFVLVLFEWHYGRPERALQSAYYILEAAENGFMPFMAEFAGRVLMDESRYSDAVRAFRICASSGVRWQQTDEQGNRSELALGEMSSRFYLAQSLLYSCVGKDVRAIENEVNEAEEQIDVILGSSDPNWSDEARYLLAQIMLLRHAPERAAATLEKILESPDLNPYLLLRAGNLLHDGDLDGDAEKFYRAALTANEEYVTAQASARLGSILFFRALYEEALPHLDQALDLMDADGSYSAVATMIGLIFGMRGETSAAKEKFESALAADDDPVWAGQARWALANILRGEGDWPRAANLIDEAIRNDTSGANIMMAYMNGCALKARGRIDEARQAFEQAIALGGTNASKATCQLASVMYDDHRDEAIGLLSSVLAVEGEPGKLAHRWLGLAHLAARDYVNAAAVLEEAVFSDSPDIISAYGLLYAYQHIAEPEGVERPRWQDATEIIVRLRVQGGRLNFDDEYSAEEIQAMDFLGKVRDSSESVSAADIFIPHDYC